MLLVLVVLLSQLPLPLMFDFPQNSHQFVLELRLCGCMFLVEILKHIVLLYQPFLDSGVHLADSSQEAIERAAGESHRSRKVSCADPVQQVDLVLAMNPISRGKS